MPRRPRVFVEGGIYHVYNRFARGAEIFSEGDEAEKFLELLKKVKSRDGLTAPISRRPYRYLFTVFWQ